MIRIVGLGAFFMDLCLLLSAFSPLFLIGSVRAEDSALMWWLLGIGVLFTAALLIPVLGAWGRAPRQFRIEKVQSASGEVAAYVATYILPLLVVGDKHPRDLAAYALCLALVGVIFIRGHLLHYNPWIFVFKRQVFSVYVGQNRYYLVAENEPRPDTDITAKLFAGRFLLM
jgi:hypothetical protein